MRLFTGILSGVGLTAAAAILFSLPLLKFFAISAVTLPPQLAPLAAGLMVILISIPGIALAAILAGRSESTVETP